MNKILVKTARKLCRSALTPGNSRLASTFKAAVFKEMCKPLEIEERKVKEIESNQVRVQVNYCSVNVVDCHNFQSGIKELPFIPGYELSGEVIEKGSDVPDEDIRVGDRVAGLSFEHYGGLAEQCVLDKDDVWRIPGDLEKKDAAIVVYSHSAAVYAFSRLCKIKENERVLVSIGPGGLGLAAVDVAANVYKAKAVGLIDDQELGELVRKSGAFETLTFSGNLTNDCLSVTEGKGVHIAYDAVGLHMTERMAECVALGGKMIHAYPITFKTILTPKPHTFATILKLKEMKKQNKHLYRTVVNDTLQLANDEVIGAHTAGKFSLSEINEAVKFILDKKSTGKVLIEIDD